MTRRRIPTSTSCCAACRASTARSSSTSAWCSTARRPTSSQAAWNVDRDRLRRPRPAHRRRPGLRGARLRRRGLCRATSAGETPAGSRSAPGSASSRRRAAPWSSRGRCTAASPTTRRASSSTCWRGWSGEGLPVRRPRPAVLVQRHPGTDRAVLPRLPRHPPDRDDREPRRPARPASGCSPSTGRATARRRRLPSTHTSVARDAAELLDLWGIEQVGGARHVGRRSVRRRVRRDVPRTRHRARGWSLRPAMTVTEAEGTVEDAMERLRPEFMAWRARIDPDDEDDAALAARFLAELPEADAALLRRVRRRVRRLPGLRGAGEAGGLPPRRRAAVPRVGLRPVSRPVPDDAVVRRARREGDGRRRRWWAEQLPQADVEVLPGTTHLAALLTQWPAILRRARNSDGLTTEGGTPDVGGLLERGGQAPAAVPRCAPARGSVTPTGQRPSRAVAGRHDQAGVAGPGGLAAAVRPGEHDRRGVGRRRSVASMPCSPATARSRARWTWYAASLGVVVDGQRALEQHLPVLQGLVGVRDVPRRPARASCGSGHPPAGSRGRRRGRGRTRSSSTGELVGLRQRRHLHEGRTAGRAARRRAARNTSASCSCELVGLGRQRRAGRRSACPGRTPRRSRRRRARRAGRRRRRRCGTSGPAQSWLVAMGRIPRPGPGREWA